MSYTWFIFAFKPSQEKNYKLHATEYISKIFNMKTKFHFRFFQEKIFLAISVKIDSKYEELLEQNYLFYKTHLIDFNIN